MTADSPSPPAPASEQPPAASKPPVWPSWFPALDMALAVMAVVLAFMVASFVGRHSDFWRHIAAGKLVVTGAYPFGGDPFTYTAADRVWVNPNWFGEVLMYALYSADTTGAVAVAVKAIVFAAAFGVLFLIRRGNAPLWPWAAAAAVGAVGACAFTQLRPYVFGLLLQSAVLAVVFRGNWTTGKKWRMPLILGGVTVLWANTDGFAFLVPLTLVLLWVGELIHEQFLKGLTGPPVDADPFPPVPPAPALARALVVCAVAVLLNPTFLAAAVKQPGEAVAQLLPFELDFGTSRVMAADDQLGRQGYAALRHAYFSDPIYGNNPTGYAAAFLTLLNLALGVLSVVLMAFGHRGARVSHLLPWLVFLLLAAVGHARFLGPFMLVSVVLAAAQLNALTQRLDLSRLTNHTAGQLVLLCRVGRIFTVGGLVIAMLVAWPGWLQVKTAARPLDRWVAWQVEPDEGMKRAAELLQSWRTDPLKGEALADTRGLISGTDLGDYCAWYAPAEKTFVTSRYRLHRDEMEDFIRLRQALSTRKEADPGEADKRPVTAIADKYAAGYVCLGQGYAQLRVLAVGLVQREFGGANTQTQRGTGSGSDSLWHLDGRFAVLGRVDTPEGRKRAERMVWDVSRLAFGPAATPADREADLTPGGRPNEGWEFDFFVRPKLVPVELDDSKMYSFYAEARRETLLIETQRRYEFWGYELAPSLGGVAGGGAGFQAAQIGPPLPTRSDYEFALPFLAARAARRAVAGDLDRSTAFVALAQAYQQELLPETESDDNRNQTITAYTRALARMPEPTELVRTRFTPEGLLSGCQLFRAHVRGRQLSDQYLDMARDVLADVNKLLSAATDDDIAFVPVLKLWSDVFQAMRLEIATMQQIPVERIPNDGRFIDMLIQNKMLDKTDAPQAWIPRDQKPFTLEQARERMKRLEEVVETMVRRRNDFIESRHRGGPAFDKFRVAIQLGLPGKAIDLYADSVKANQNVPLEQSVAFVGLMYHVGRLEEAHGLRLKLAEQLNGQTDTGPNAAGLRQLYRQLELTEAKLAGDFKKADAIYEELSRPQLPPKFTEPQRTLVAAKPHELVPGIGAVGGNSSQLQLLNTADTLRNQLYAEALFSFQRGLFALHDGDTKLAKRHFDQAASPQGIPLVAFTQPGQLQPQLAAFLPKYRVLLERYGN